MLAKDIIQLSNSPWALPIVLIQKNHDTQQFCVYYIESLIVSQKNTYPIPCIDDTLWTL